MNTYMAATMLGRWIKDAKKTIEIINLNNNTTISFFMTKKVKGLSQ